MKKQLGLLLGGIALMAGCSNKDLLTGAPGEYDGYVSVMAGGKIQTTLVAATITSKEKMTLNVHAQAMGGTATWDYTVKIQDASKLTLNGAKLKKSETNCFASPTSSSKPAPDERLCFDGNELGLDYTMNDGSLITMIVDRHDPSRDVKQCIPTASSPCPTSFAAADVIEHAIDQNFGTREQFETVVQARLQAQQTAALLLPHLSAGTIESVVTKGWSALTTAFSDLIPFVFLDRDFQAKEAEVQARATALTLTIEKADVGNMTEGLIYSIDRDTKIMAAFKKRLPLLTGIRDDIRQREIIGVMPVGSSDDITTIINSVESSISSLGLVIEQEYASLSQTAGYEDPKAILNVTPSDSISIDNPEPPLDTAAIRKVVMDRAYEITQIDLLTEAAHWDKWSRMFAWYDPSGDIGGSLGANLVPYMQVNYSQLRQLDIQKEAMVSTVGLKLDTALEGAAQALDAYRLAVEAVDIQQRRVLRTTEAMPLGVTFDLTALATALTAQVTADVNLYTVAATYYLAIASKNRLLYAGPYGRLAAAVEGAVPRTSSDISR